MKQVKSLSMPQKNEISGKDMKKALIYRGFFVLIVF